MPNAELTKAVILARGLGTRMRKTDAAAALSGAQAAAADTGVKALIPVGRPFLDYALAALADAGYRHVCLVVGPEHDDLRAYCGGLAARRIDIHFAVQPQPRGTADAVLAAEPFADGDHFAVVNSDNYYPPEALRALRLRLAGGGLVAFLREGLLRGNIPPDRVAKYAVVEADHAGRLVRIVEKPTDAQLAALRPPIGVSMNCWRFRPTIFEACRAIGPSPRGEWEIPDAVQFAMEKLGEAFTVLPIDEPVLDLSHRSDIAAVAARLARVEVNL